MPVETAMNSSSPLSLHILYGGGGTMPRLSSTSRMDSSSSASQCTTTPNNSRLLQLAERSNPRKSPGGNPGLSHHLLSFRNPNNNSKGPPIPSPRTYGGRSIRLPNNQYPSSSISPGLGETHAPQSSSSTPTIVRQSPKFYTNFSSKSSTKLKKAFIKSDPLKTNIEHLVVNSSSSGNHKPSPSSSNCSSSSSQNSPADSSSSTSTSKGINSFITTPLKALHASFHDRTKLGSVFSPPRGGRLLFSQRIKRLPQPPPQHPNPDFLDHPHHPQQNPSASCSSSYPPDILGDCLGIQDESNYIILKKQVQKRKSGTIHNNEDYHDHHHQEDHYYQAQIGNGIRRMPTTINTDSDNNSSPFSPFEEGRMKMSTAPPIKISSSSHAHIITLTQKERQRQNTNAKIKMEMQPDSGIRKSDEVIIPQHRHHQNQFGPQHQHLDSRLMKLANNNNNNESSDSANKCKPVRLLHSLSFRSDKEKRNPYSTLMNDEEENGIQLRGKTRDYYYRSKSLPKSFMNNNGGGGRRKRSSLWTRESQAELPCRSLEKLVLSSEDNLTLTSPELSPSSSSTSHSHSEESGEGETSSYSSDNTSHNKIMRWQKSGTTSTSQEPQGGVGTGSGGGGSRPKSFDYSQRKAWMKYYREMEMSSASGKPPKGNASQNPQEEMGISRRTPETLQVPPSASLFQRFSKTFSLRFGSNSNVSTSSNNNKQTKQREKVGGGVGASSPELHKVSSSNGKLRQTKSKSVRDEKCQSGDSGIGIDDNPSSHPSSSSTRLRRIRSEYIDTSSSSSPRHSVPDLKGKKMSLVEIPNHVWGEEGQGLGHGPPGGGVYEDVLESKLEDNENDDGFSSSGEEVPKSKYGSNYHSLPHKKLRNQSVPSTDDSSIRGKVIREILLTEQNYVKTLNDIVQGFLNPCRARTDLFSPEVVRNIFSNLEDILRLHARFLEALKERLDPDGISMSTIGHIFTEWEEEFTPLYSEYCCNNPISMVTVRSLMGSGQYVEFFEACRRLQLMDKLPLHGFLLRPIQRICQYHLQLQELLKHTEESHADYGGVVEGVETMKKVAMKINDKQKEFDALQEVVKMQNSIEGLHDKGRVDLTQRNSSILMKGELIKTTTLGKQRSKEVYCFLLNKDILFCKEREKKSKSNGGNNNGTSPSYLLEGKIDLEVGVWLNIDSNEEDEYFGMVHNSWRVYSHDLKAWVLFTASSPSEKRKWISALENSTSTSSPPDPKMRQMAKLIALLSADDRLNPSPNSHYFNNSPSVSTLSKSNKKSHKEKERSSSASVTQNGDTMLIEVGKLRRPTYPLQQNSTRTSKFYV